MKAVSSVFIALFVLILAFGSIFVLLYAMNLQPVQSASPAPHLYTAYSETTQYFNVTNTGANMLAVSGFAVFQGKGAFVIPYTASLNSGQETSVYLYSAIKPNETIAVLTNEGAYEVKIT
ncbi:MAG: hypothetical protein JRN26_02890 [Nitrososphaerota archaeon]|jgi:hypothetical protein|nr:hypothetical protein [Nitrososphaerota archaeon]MDG6928287.1 hypothetical protein [Nitrososphaerota archaeon]MDG6931562.1 hypothetical protein [Nitrososphaerota archaeon]MDG6935821.1 hypothetical protein [Nitrososphaerota archaeon]MDG6943480.1 hypothetical protein [Nitrososphaerota archaeon]